MTGAPARALDLLPPAARPPSAEVPHGWLDLAGGDVPATGATQALMLTRAVPAVYDRWWRPALGRIVKGPLGPGMGGEHRLLHDLLRPGEGDVVLDVACGPGTFTRSLAAAVGPRGLVVGIDASPTMLARAVRDTPAPDAGWIAYVRGDAVRLPFADARFDAVCCFGALHLFAEPLAAVDHMARVLRPGGRLALLTSCARSALLVPERVAGRVTGMRIFARHEVTRALAERGFTAIEQRVAGVTQFVGAVAPAAGAGRER